MDKIKVLVLNPDAAKFGEQAMVAGARLTQRGHNIKTMDDLVELWNRSYQKTTARSIAELPHANIQRFSAITVAVVGASRRFLAQITRHQDDVHFISTSLQYSDYTDNAAFCVPYELIHKDYYEMGDAANEHGYYTRNYLLSQQQAMSEYQAAIARGIDNDSAGYMMPHGLRNVLLISATPFQWAHMISQRTCNRNTPETQYVMLRIWEQLFPLSVMFHECGPDCTKVCGCREGKMACGKPMPERTKVLLMDKEVTISAPTQIIQRHFPLCNEVSE